MLIHEIFSNESTSDKYGKPANYSKHLEKTFGECGDAKKNESTLNEYRNALYDFVKSKFPTWPEYVLKDFLYSQTKHMRDEEELKDFLERNQKDFGQVKWRLEKLPITLDIFTPKTQRMIKQREGGSSNPYQVPKDAERHAQQLKMIQQQGVRTEPIIVAKLNNGYDLIEGWHRTIQHLQQYPEGYTGPAWVAYGATYTSESKQGVKENFADGIPQPGPSSGAPKQFGPDAKIQTRQMTVKEIISSIPGVPYYNNVVDDWDAKDYSWGVTKKVIAYANYLKQHPETLSKLPPIIVLNGKFEDGAHRVSAIWLLQQRIDPKNSLWKNAKLNVQFVKQGVKENLRAWFGKGKKGGAGGGGWDRYNTKGERIGKCGDAKKSEGKPKCLSKSRAASLRAKGGKKAIAAAVNKKRRDDPNKNRRGKAKNVSNTVKTRKKK